MWGGYEGTITSADDEELGAASLVGSAEETSSVGVGSSWVAVSVGSVESCEAEGSEPSTVEAVWSSPEPSALLLLLDDGSEEGAADWEDEVVATGWADDVLELVAWASASTGALVVVGAGVDDDAAITLTLEAGTRYWFDEVVVADAEAPPERSATVVTGGT
jgi:hypothetical protein